MMENISCVSHQTPKLWLEDLGLLFCLLKEESEMDLSVEKLLRRATAVKKKSRGISGDGDGVVSQGCSVDEGEVWRC